MRVQKRKKGFKPTFAHITGELREHVPFTAFGAATGVGIMFFVFFFKVSPQISYTAFYTLHPFHVVLSALVTTALYRLHARSTLWKAFLIGYTGSIGIATLSDVIIPYIGIYFLGIHIPFVVPFIANWWINLLAVAGILIGYFRPTTKFPHAGHVLLSTWASLFSITQYGVHIAGWMFPFVFLFLFLAVWLPCCVSDIIYPLLFIREK